MMPRARPTMVQEHRITLGDYERKQLETAIQAANADQDLAMALDVVKAVAMPVAVGAVAYLGYLGLTNFGLGLDVLREKWTAYVAESKAAQAVVATAEKFAVDVSQGLEGEGGGGGSRTGVFGGSVFM